MSFHYLSTLYIYFVISKPINLANRSLLTRLSLFYSSEEFIDLSVNSIHSKTDDDVRVPFSIVCCFSTNDCNQCSL